MIRDFWQSSDAMLAEAAREGCRWTQLATWIYWKIYDLYPASAAHASREALAAQKVIIGEPTDIITQELLAVDPEYCEKSSDAPYNQPWRWKKTLVTKIADIVREYREIEGKL